MSSVWTLEELAAILSVPQRQIINADKRSPHGLLSWTRLHSGYCLHESLLPALRAALAQMPVSTTKRRVRTPRTLLRHKL
jgi:hypothetical protein